MRIRREQLSVLLNRLYDRGDERFSVSHPSTEIGELLTVSLDDHDDCTVRFTTGRDDYATARNDVARDYPKPVSDDLPEPDQYLKAVLASGIVRIPNFETVKQLVERYGDPDLMAGHPPVLAGFDTNLLPWRIDRILGLRDPNEGVGYVNGFVLATGVRDELDWDYKCHDTDPFVDAFGDAYEEYWNQPLGAARIGRLGLLSYRGIRDIQQAQEVESDVGDESIVEAYNRYDHDHRSQMLLFSNDRNFVERARANTILSEHVEFPSELPRKASASWEEIEVLIYMLAMVFGVVELPGGTVHGVWRGKDELDWQRERIEFDCRSPTLKPQIESDLSIVESYDEFATDR